MSAPNCSFPHRRLVLLAPLLCLLAAGSPGDARAAGPTMSEASALYDRGEWKKAAEAYGAITKADPKNGLAWYRLGVCRGNQKEYESAVEAYLKSEAIGHAFPVMYNLACAYAQLADTARAFEWLSKAAENGLRGPDAVRADADLAPLRDSPRYAEILAKVAFNERPCAHRSENRQMDFWIGDWEVTRTSEGTLAGTNRITLDNGDCVLYEHWESARYGTGQSMNYYDPVTKKWHQSWVDDQGEVSIFDGGFRDGAMRLEGYRQGTDGARIPARLTLTPMPDGSVRQLGENSEDGGKTWSTTYDLTYRRKK
jgi:tetratricopeptide (TPR) repeat protein